MIARLLAALGALAGGMAAAQTPQVFIAETRVAVHDEPGGEPLASFAPGTKPIEASAVRDGWARIIFRERDAWVPLDGLAPLEPRMAAGGLAPDGLVCSGTEPFWTLSLDGGTARMTRPMAGDAALLLAWSVAAAGRRHPVRIRLDDARGAVWGDALLEPGLCSDGMSDRTYPWRAAVLPAEGGLWTGCCRLPRSR